MVQSRTSMHATIGMLAAQLYSTYQQRTGADGTPLVCMKIGCCKARKVGNDAVWIDRLKRWVRTSNRGHMLLLLLLSGWRSKQQASKGKLQRHHMIKPCGATLPTCHQGCPFLWRRHVQDAAAGVYQHGRCVRIQR